MEAPDFYTGAPIDAADLRYRDDFVHLVWDELRTKHVVLTAPRRTGKTSIMDHLRARPRAGFTVIYENVQDLEHPADFFASLLARFHDEHPKLFRDVLGRGWDLVATALRKIESIGVSEFKVALRESDPDWRTNWKRHGAQFLDRVRHHDKPVLLIVDELPDMLLNMRSADEAMLREFLAWFRTQRQNPKPKDDRVRWLVGGSVNLSSTLDAIQMVDLINDLEDVTLPVLRDEDVIHFVQSMLTARRVEFDDDVPERVRVHLGRPIPLFMQMITLSLYRNWKRRRTRLSAADADAAFTELVMSNAARDKLQHYYSRLDRYYDEPGCSAAHELLGRISLTSRGIGRDRLLQDFEGILDQQGITAPPHQRKQMFNRLLRDLENDFYIAEVRVGEYDFASGLLKAWWKKYYA